MMNEVCFCMAQCLKQSIANDVHCRFYFVKCSFWNVNVHWIPLGTDEKKIIIENSLSIRCFFFLLKCSQSPFNAHRKNAHCILLSMFFCCCLQIFTLALWSELHFGNCRSFLYSTLSTSSIPRLSSLFILPSVPSRSISIIDAKFELNEAHILWGKFSEWKPNFQLIRCVRVKTFSLQFHFFCSLSDFRVAFFVCATQCKNTRARMSTRRNYWTRNLFRDVVRTAATAATEAETGERHRKKIA